MRSRPSRTALLPALFLLAAPIWAQSDLAVLKQRLGAARYGHWLSQRDYQRAWDAYLPWLEARLRKGESPEQIEASLKAAHLTVEWPSNGEDIDEMFKAHAGFAAGCRLRTVRGDAGLKVLAAGLYTGATGCALDETAVLYDRDGWRPLGVLRAPGWRYDEAWSLCGLDVGPPDSEGARLVASAWCFSNCTSNWNGKTIHIERLKSGRTESLFRRPVFASYDFNTEDELGEAISSRVEGPVVSFFLSRFVAESSHIRTPGIARYRVTARAVERILPIGLSRLGFLQEWLEAKPVEAARWSEAEALRQRARLQAAIDKQGYELDFAANCGGTPEVWELGVHPNESPEVFVVRMQGTHASELRILSAGTARSAGCRTVEPGEGVGSELPMP